MGSDRIWICDRDPKWSSAVEAVLTREGVRIIRTPARAPNCNAYPERFVQSIKEECLDRLIVLGEWRLRRVLTEFMVHDHVERNNQGLGNELIEPLKRRAASGPLRRRQPLGGMLNYYYRAV